MLAGTVTPVPQDDAGTTLAPMLTREDGHLAWSRRADELVDRVRGFYPWPGAWTTVQGQVLKLFPPVSRAPGDGPAGMVVAANGDGLVVATGDGAIRLGSVQLAGRRRMGVAELLRGFPLPMGTVLGS